MSFRKKYFPITCGICLCNADSNLYFVHKLYMKVFMQHKLYAAAFHLTENEAARRIYYGFRGDKETIDNVRDRLKALALEFQREEKSGKDRHDEILYIEAFLEELDTDKVRGIQ